MEEKERQKDILRFTVETDGWKEIVEPELKRILMSARANERSSMAKATIEEAGKQFVESMAVEIVVSGLLKKINNILGVKEDLNG
jgi:hypothetical protein